MKLIVTHNGPDLGGKPAGFHKPGQLLCDSSGVFYMRIDPMFGHSPLPRTSQQTLLCLSSGTYFNSDGETPYWPVSSVTLEVQP